MLNAPCRLAERARGPYSVGAVPRIAAHLLTGTRSIVLALLFVASALALPHSAAAGGWTTPAVPVTPAEEQPTRLGAANTDALGRLTVFWSDGPDSASSLLTSTRSLSGQWTKPFLLTKATGEPPTEITVVPDGSGNLMAVWRRVISGRGRVGAAMLGASGAWQGAATVLSNNDGAASSASLAVDHAGRWTAIWLQQDNGQSILQSSTRTAGTAWSSATPVVSSTAVSDPKLTVDGAGNASIVYAVPTGSEPAQQLQVVRRPAGAESEWGQPVTLAAFNGQPNRFALATNPAGAMAAAVVSGPAAGPCELLVSVLPPGGDWTSQSATSIDAADCATTPGVGLDEAGRVGVSWTPPTADRVRAALRTAAGLWTAPNDLVTPDGAGYAETRVEPTTDREFQTFWTRTPPGGGPTTLWASGQSGSGQWSTPRRLGAASGTNVLQRDGAKGLVGVWQAPDAALPAPLEVRAYDAGGPRLSDIAIPSIAYIGDPTALSVTTIDTWTRVRGSSWEFDDDSGASPDNAVVHTWSVPGIHRVDFSAVDALGNTSTIRRWVEVRVRPVDPATTPITPTTPVYPTTATTPPPTTTTPICDPPVPGCVSPPLIPTTPQSTTPRPTTPVPPVTVPPTTRFDEFITPPPQTPAPPAPTPLRCVSGQHMFVPNTGARCGLKPVTTFKVGARVVGKRLSGLYVLPTVAKQTISVRCITSCNRKAKRVSARSKKKTSQVGVSKVGLRVGSIVEVSIAQRGRTTRFARFRVLSKDPFLRRDAGGCRTTSWTAAC